MEKDNFTAELFRDLPNVRGATRATYREVNREEYFAEIEHL
jgi:hypothetical protein